MAKKVMQKGYFPQWDFPGLLICYRAHFSVPETVETICIAISLRLTPFFHKMIGLLGQHLLIPWFPSPARIPLYFPHW